MIRKDAFANHYLSLFAFLLSLLFIISCTKPEPIDPIFRWPPSGESGADSILAAVERQFQGFSLGGRMVPSYRGQLARLCSIADRHPGNRGLQVRKRFAMAIDDISVDPRAFTTNLEKGFSLTDSARYPYEFYKLKMLRAEVEEDPARKYEEMMECLGYFSEKENPMEVAVCYVTAGNIMTEIHDTLRALEFNKRAYDVLSRINNRHASAIAAINVAVNSKPRQADSINRALLADPWLYNDPDARVLVLQNLYSNTDSLPLLEEALEIYSRVGRLRKDNIPILIALAGDYYSRHGDPEKGLKLLQEALDSALLLTPGSAYHTHIIHNFTADAYLRAGQADSAAAAYRRAREQREIYEQGTGSTDVYAMDVATRIRMTELHARLEKNRQLTVLVVVILLLLLGAVIAWAMMRKRRAEKAFREKLLQDRIDRTTQSVRAQSKVMEEMDTLLEAVEEKISELEHTRKITEEGSDTLMRLLKLHKSNEDNRQGFLKVQKELDLNFADNLRKDYPDLSEGQIKFAAMIACGIDSRQIGNILNIENASVHKNRYRLRKRLGLDKTQNLEQFLRRYNKTGPE